MRILIHKVELDLIEAFSLLSNGFQSVFA